MRLTCQACGAVISLDAAIGHEGAREAIQIALQLPASLGQQLIKYVGMFRPVKQQLSMDRVAKLMGELLDMIQAAQIERNGRLYVAPHEYWQNALDSMIAGRDKLTLPLKSHGYLLEIIAGYADKAEARAEAKKEEHARHHTRSDHVAGGGKVIRRDPRKLGDVLAEINGKKPSQEKPNGDTA